MRLPNRQEETERRDDEIQSHIDGVFKYWRLDQQRLQTQIQGDDGGSADELQRETLYAAKDFQPICIQRQWKIGVLEQIVQLDGCGDVTSSRDADAVERQKPHKLHK